MVSWETLLQQSSSLLQLLSTPQDATADTHVWHSGARECFAFPERSPVFAYMLEFNIRVGHEGNPIPPISQGDTEAPGDTGAAH